jgi:hypothetical protein
LTIGCHGPGAPPGIFEGIAVTKGLHDLLQRSGSCPRSGRRPHELPRPLGRERTTGREASTASLPARQTAKERNGVLHDASAWTAGNPRSSTRFAARGRHV